jgi:hypothetical protein
MKPPTLIGSYPNTERTNRRQEEDIRMVLKRGDFAGLVKEFRLSHNWWICFWIDSLVDINIEYNALHSIKIRRVKAYAGI